jgi:chaperonin GroES
VNALTHKEAMRISPLYKLGVDAGLATVNADTSGIVPLDQRVVVLRDVVEEKTKGGIILPDSERDKQKHATTRATVIAVGPCAWAEAKHDAPDSGYPEPGSRVIVGRYTGDNHKGVDGAEYTILNDTDVIALLTEE